jgi:phosphoglucosamine mutase
MAAAIKLQGMHKASHKKVVIGKDTRESCYMLEQAMASGFLAMGMDVTLLGPLPTPAVANLTRSLRADLGVMISASHNPYYDNGIKLFGYDGFKLSDETELEIEELMQSDLTEHYAQAGEMGRAKRLERADGRYIEYLKSTLPRRLRFNGLKIVVDCANGAAYRVAPDLFWEMGAEVITIGVNPNGRNINDTCGATHTQALQDKVIAEKADLGIALDGDADRLIMVDQHGQEINGDQLMAVIARDMHEKGRLKNATLVATVMSNLGLERYLKSLSIDLRRTAVGDRYVVEAMKESGSNLGGEQSGHIILSDYATTGDGLLAALHIIAILIEKETDMASLCNLFDIIPQHIENIKLGALSADTIMDSETMKAAIKKAQEDLNGDGRIFVRPSGTEPLIRIMAECDDSARLHHAINDVAAAVTRLKQ